MSEAAARSHPGWRIATLVVSAASLAWVLWLLAAAWPDLAAHRGELRVWPVLQGLVLSAAGSCFTFGAFVALAPIFGISGLSRRELEPTNKHVRPAPTVWTAIALARELFPVPLEPYATTESVVARCNAND